jgi:hypothetical protein
MTKTSYSKTSFDKDIALTRKMAAAFRSRDVFYIEPRHIARLRRHTCMMSSNSEYATQFETVSGIDGEDQLALFERGGVRVGTEQTYDALAWLYKNRRSLPLGKHELACLTAFDHFELMGFAYVAPAHAHGIGCAAPIYRVVSTHAQHFDYVGWAWQSGRKPCVL